MFGHACKAQTAAELLSSLYVCHQLTVSESRSVKGEVEDTQERILSLRIVRTHPHLLAPPVRDVEETSGCGATGGLVEVLWIGHTGGAVELTES